MADDGFVTAVGPDGKKRRVPKHYLKPPFNYKLPASARAQEPATPANTIVTEPAKPGEHRKEVTGQ